MKLHLGVHDTTISASKPTCTQKHREWFLINQCHWITYLWMCHQFFCSDAQVSKRNDKCFIRRCNQPNRPIPFQPIVKASSFGRGYQRGQLLLCRCRLENRLLPRAPIFCKSCNYNEIDGKKRNASLHSIVQCIRARL